MDGANCDKVKILHFYMFPFKFLLNYEVAMRLVS